MRRVVITRVGAITPNANSWPRFSEALKKGRSGLGVIDRFNPESFTTRIAGQIFNFDPQPLIQTFPILQTIADIKVFFGLQAFLEMLGQKPLDGNGCAVNLGTSLECFQMDKVFRLSPHTFQMDRYINALEHHKNEPFLQVPLDYLGVFLKRFFKLHGPNFLHCSACTASTQAMGHSFHMIRDGRFERIVTGGFDSMINPLGLGGFSALGALSDENDRLARAIRPFDATRQGTILGEGAAMFLFEDLNSALKNGSEILGEITGYGSSLDAHKISEPSCDGIVQAMERALADAGLTPSDIDYISAHGTGTPINDTMETQAIKRVFTKEAKNIPVSSIKSMIGHLIGASGAVEIAGILAMINHGFIAPTINLDHLDPTCNLDYVPHQSRDAQISVAMKNSMGFGGQNASLIIQRFIP